MMTKNVRVIFILTSSYSFIKQRWEIKMKNLSILIIRPFSSAMKNVQNYKRRRDNINNKAIYIKLFLSSHTFLKSAVDGRIRETEMKEK